MNLLITYSQNDPRWKNNTLGTKGTIGAYGCLMTDATMVANYYGHQETPLTLNQKLLNNNGYQNGNLFVWGVFASLFGLKYSGQFSNSKPLTKEQMDQIRKAIDKGYPVFLQIDTVPADADLDEHWILATGYDGDDFIIQDPWDGAKKRITSWGVKPQELIYAWCWFEGKVPQSSDEMVTYPKSERDWLVGRATIAKDVAIYLAIENPDHAPFDAYQRVIAGIKSRSTDLEKQLGYERTEKENREQQVSRLKEQLLSEEKLRKDLEHKLTDALKQPASIVGVYEGKLKEKQTLIDSQGKQIGDLKHQVTDLELQLKQCKEKLTAPLSVWDVLVILVHKSIPFLKEIKLS